jgi:hypothetical protein
MLKGCIADNGAGGCLDATPGKHPLTGANDVAVSPDGASVYLTSSSGITHFKRAVNGSLSYAGCISFMGQEGCTNPGAGSLVDTQAVDVSQDNTSVYTTSGISVSPIGQITHFSRTASEPPPPAIQPNPVPATSNPPPTRKKCKKKKKRAAAAKKKCKKRRR